MLASGERAEASFPRVPQSDGEAADSIIRDLNRRLAREITRRERGEARISELAATLSKSDEALERSLRQGECIKHELEIVESQLVKLAQPASTGLADQLDLSGTSLLYVGGRAHQIPQIKGLIERAGARFLHHDGGIGQSSGLLPGLVGRADRVFFPIDCISHDAATTIKRQCRASGRSYEPLRTASLACLLAALLRMRGCREMAPA
jgi:hypothetical protein